MSDDVVPTGRRSSAVATGRSRVLVIGGKLKHEGYAKRSHLTLLTCDDALRQAGICISFQVRKARETDDATSPAAGVHEICDAHVAFESW